MVVVEVRPDQSVTQGEVADELAAAGLQTRALETRGSPINLLAPWE